MAEVTEAVTIDVLSEDDVVRARTQGKDLARRMGFGTVDQTRVATGISELTRNILQYAHRGRITLRPISSEVRHGLEILAEDNGPGIPNLRGILEGRFQPARGLGLGIPGTRRLMDEFELTSQVGQGTRVRCIKWRTS